MKYLLWFVCLITFSYAYADKEQLNTAQPGLKHQQVWKNGKDDATMADNKPFNLQNNLPSDAVYSDD